MTGNIIISYSIFTNEYKLNARGQQISTESDIYRLTRNTTTGLNSPK